MLSLMTCPHCGSSEFVDVNNIRMCAYCRSNFKEDVSERGGTTINVREDVDRLLDKCRKDPRNASRYAELVLDIDPFNKEALTFIR